MALNDYERDVLKETGNIGAGNALTYLSKMLNNELIDLNLSEVHMMNESMIIDLHPEDSYTTHSKIEGDINGCVSFHLTKKEALKIINKLAFKNEKITNLNELGKQVLIELGTILGGSYAASVGELFEMDIISTDCKLCEEKETSIEELKSLGKNLIKLNTIFSVYDEEVFSKIWLVLDDDSAKKILNKAN